MPPHLPREEKCRRQERYRLQRTSRRHVKRFFIGSLCRASHRHEQWDSPGCQSSANPEGISIARYKGLCRRSLLEFGPKHFKHLHRACRAPPCAPRGHPYPELHEDNIMPQKLSLKSTFFGSLHNGQFATPHCSARRRFNRTFSFNVSGSGTNAARF